MYRRSVDDEHSSWEHLVENLVSELKHERNAYYGSEGSEQERAYPGLDYTNPKIRYRLVRWPHHQKLFRAFDALDLSNSEIESVAVWWGTAKNKRLYEAQTGEMIRDTIADEIPSEDQLDLAERKAREERQHQEFLAYTLQQAELEIMIKSAETSAFQAMIGAQEMQLFHTQFPHLMDHYINFTA